MMNNNLLLYGSYARGDQDMNSDIDMLSLIDGKCQKIENGKISLYLYNYSFFIDIAKEGSLFVFHLKEESKTLIDEINIYDDIFKNHFRLKPNYNSDIIFARDLLRLLVDQYENIVNYSFANRKIAWCLRTIIASLGANERIPLFSKSSICHFFNSSIVELMQIKKSQQKETNSLNEIYKFCMAQTESIGKLHYVPTPDFMKYRSKIIQSIFSEYS